MASGIPLTALIVWGGALMAALILGGRNGFESHGLPLMGAMLLTGWLAGVKARVTTHATLFVGAAQLTAIGLAYRHCVVQGHYDRVVGGPISTFAFSVSMGFLASLLFGVLFAIVLRLATTGRREDLRAGSLSLSALLGCATQITLFGTSLGPASLVAMLGALAIALLFPFPVGPGESA